MNGITPNPSTGAHTPLIADAIALSRAPVRSSSFQRPITDNMLVSVRTNAQQSAAAAWIRPGSAVTLARPLKAMCAALWAAACGTVGGIKATIWDIYAALCACFGKRTPASRPSLFLGRLPSLRGDSFAPALASAAPPRAKITIVQHQPVRPSRTLQTLHATLTARTHKLIKTQQRLGQVTQTSQNRQSQAEALQQVLDTQKQALQAAQTEVLAQTSQIGLLEQQLDRSTSAQENLKARISKSSLTAQEAVMGQELAERALEEALTAESHVQRQLRRANKQIETLQQKAEETAINHAYEVEAMDTTIADLHERLALSRKLAQSLPPPQRMLEDGPHTAASVMGEPSTFAKPQSPRAVRRRAVSAQLGSPIALRSPSQNR